MDSNKLRSEISNFFDAYFDNADLYWRLIRMCDAHQVHGVAWWLITGDVSMIEACKHSGIGIVSEMFIRLKLYVIQGIMT